MKKTASKTTANASIAQAQYKAMAAVAKKVKTWNDTSYKKATDELYALLAECYSVTLTTRAQSTAVMRELNKLLVEKGLTFNDGTKLETKVVRVAFGNIGKRAHIYARVLVNAREQAVDAKEFAKWLTAQGGVEAVRRQHKGLTPTQVKQQKVKTAEEAFKTVGSKLLTSAPKVDGSDYVLALVQHRKNGKCEVVSFCDNLPLIKQTLAKLSDSAKAEADTKHRSELEAANRKLMRDIKQAEQTIAAAA
jgi:hypothetical protein